MKRMLLLLFAIGMVTMSSISMAAMSTSKVRKNTRFLTDRMAHELNLSSEQYNDSYEINFDFIYNVRYLMDDVVLGNNWALEDYYRLLDVRNDDLRWVLSAHQYNQFLGMEYFHRPIFASGNTWNFRVNLVYTNSNFFYFGKPHHYRNYNGGHYRTHYDNASYYRNRYHHDIHHGNHSVRNYDKYYRDDFGITTRPSTGGSNTRPSSRPSRPSKDDIYDNPRPGSSSTGRPSSGSPVTTRPSGSSSTRPSSSGSSASRPSTNTKPSPSGSSTSRPSTTTRPSSTVKESSSGSTQSSSSRVSERSSSSSNGSSSENRSNSSSSGSARGGRR